MFRKFKALPIVFTLLTAISSIPAHSVDIVRTSLNETEFKSEENRKIDRKEAVKYRNMAKNDFLLVYCNTVPARIGRGCEMMTLLHKSYVIDDLGIKFLPYKLFKEYSPYPNINFNFSNELVGCKIENHKNLTFIEIGENEDIESCINKSILSHHNFLGGYNFPNLISVLAAKYIDEKAQKGSVDVDMVFDRIERIVGERDW